MKMFAKDNERMKSNFANNGRIAGIKIELWAVRICKMVTKTQTGVTNLYDPRNKTTYYLRGIRTQTS